MIDDEDEGKTCPVCNNPDVPVVTTRVKGNDEVAFATREYRCDCCGWRGQSWEEEI
jgi:transcription elongation factor Elf1